MTVAELDRLVSKTELTPARKQALRHVRKAVISGRATNPEVHRYDWSVGVTQQHGGSVRFSFSLRKATASGDDQA